MARKLHPLEAVTLLRLRLNPLSNGAAFKLTENPRSRSGALFKPVIALRVSPPKLLPRGVFKFEALPQP